MSASDKNRRGRVLKPEDEALWETIAKGVKPLGKTTKRVKLARKGAKAPSPSPSEKPAPAKKPDNSPVKPVAKKPALSSRAKTASPANDLEPRLKRRLTRGNRPIEAELDLHGLTEARAHAALKRFFLSCRKRNIRSVLVITGKGKTSAQAGSGVREEGVLRRALPRWLAEPGFAEMVVAFSTAGPRHGGSGAYYVQLRRLKAE